MENIHIMENNHNSYIQADNNVIINELCIRWVKKIGDCLEVCTKIDGCNTDNTHKICKLISGKSYEKLNKHFL